MNTGFKELYDTQAVWFKGECTEGPRMPYMDEWGSEKYYMDGAGTLATTASVAALTLTSLF